MTIGTAGLVLFVAVVAVNVVGLWLDLALLTSGRETITQRVWKCPPLGLPILTWQLAGLAGLAVHFYAR
jgi:hypothetical protein